jgi:hypothetical protein
MTTRPARWAALLRARWAAVLRAVADRLEPRPPAPALVAAAACPVLSPSSTERMPLEVALAQLNLVKAHCVLRDALGPRNHPQAVAS